MPAPQKIIELVERFERNKEAYEASRYNETQVRREFIDPLFKALGWDIDNEQGYAEAYKDVIHEDAIHIGGMHKAPDYCMRIGGVRKFFVEAKKPSVNVKDDADPAFQVRRYAWSAKLPLSILTDFQEMAIYDCRLRPAKTDGPVKARILYFTYKDYIEKWDEIAAIFSRDAVLKGSFDAYAEKTKQKKGTEEVDEAFLKEIEKWRELLAKNIALKNPELSQRELNYAVQVTIDRLVFLRICEDRGIENYARLLAEVNGTNIYGRLKQHFRDADNRYNSGLFHFENEKDQSEAPDTLTLGLNIEDSVLKEIISHLYYPESPYEFSVLSADILGQVYEQFLGKVIRLTDGHRAKIEEKPEVRKAGGVYYTPTYIVQYIVENTVGKLVEGKTSKEVASLKICDPACGSGSFLLGAYQFLLDWHLTYYTENDPKKWSKQLTQGIKGDWRLTTAERKRILLANIYGVDIDAQAVEVTKLSLLLKVLEGETAQSVQTTFVHERVLPNLGSNIKCGNSLIGPDFYTGQQMGLLESEEQYRINVFDWEKAFPQVFSGKNPGFDTIIGNPPYIFTRELMTETERDYYGMRYKMSWEKKNTFMLFMELMLGLLRKQGMGSFIVPNSWLTIESAKLLRSALIPHLAIVDDLNYQVFRGVSMEPCIFILEKGITSDNQPQVSRSESKGEFEEAQRSKIDRNRWISSGRITISISGAVESVLDKISGACTTIGEVFNVFTGLQAYEEGKGAPPQTKEDVKNHVFDCLKKDDSTCYKYLQGKDVGRYFLHWSGMWMKYGAWLSQPRTIDIFSRPRVLLREITSELPYCLHAVFVDTPFLNNKSVLNILHRSDDIDGLKVLLAVINSKLISVFYKNRAVKSARKIFPKVVIKNLREFPFPREISLSERKPIVSMAEARFGLQEKISVSKIPSEIEQLKQQLKYMDLQIDELIYQLYGLDEKDVEIITSAL